MAKIVPLSRSRIPVLYSPRLSLMPEPAPAIVLQALTAGHFGGPAVLHDLHWQVAAGSRVGLVGPNGAGKSTLLLTLAGVIPARQGTATVEGFDLTTLAGRRGVPQVMGLLLQDPDDQLLETSVAGDVALGPTSQGLSAQEITARVDEALLATGLGTYRQRVPQRLSLGEKKRVALAGVLARRPTIILLDEPTAGLDPRGRRELIALLAGLSATLVVATHDLELVLELCSAATVMDGGRFVALGFPRDLLADGPLMDGHGLEVPWPLRGQLRADRCP